MSIRHVTLRDISAAQSWVPTPCVIEQAAFVPDAEGHRSLQIQFRYEFGGVTYRSNRLDLMPGSMGDDGAWERDLLERHPARSEATCYVDPQRPESAVLDRDHGTAGANNLRLLAFPFLFLGGGAFLVLAWIVASSTRIQRRPRGLPLEMALKKPRRMGVGQTLAFLLITPGDVKFAWAFFVGFAFVFTILGGPTALWDLLPTRGRRAVGQITHVGPTDSRELGQTVYEYEFRFEADGQTHTGKSLTRGRRYGAGDRVDVAFDRDHPEAAVMRSARRSYAPIWVSAIPLLVLMLLGLGIGGNYAFNMTTLRLFWRGDLIKARRVEKIADESVAEGQTKSIRIEYVFDAHHASHRVEPRSHLSPEATIATVLYHPRNPKRNLGVNDERLAILMGKQNPWLAAANGAVVPITCLAAIAWFLGWW
jgi:hypothetical protein